MSHPLPVTVLGYGAAVLTTLSFFPQAIKTVRSGDTSGISLPMYVLFTAGISLWGIYGLLTRDGRMKERKKYGLRGARRGTQFSKR